MRKCEHRKQGRTPGARYWICLDCGARIDGCQLPDEGDAGSKLGGA